MTETPGYGEMTTRERDEGTTPERGDATTPERGSGGGFIKGTLLGFFSLAFLLVLGLLIWQTITGASLFGSVKESRSELVVNSLTLEEEVVFLSLGIQGITEESTHSTLFGQRVPGSGRTTFLQYNYNAKLGIDGRDVTIEETGENSYLVTIPPFEFLGYDDAKFETIVEDNGLLSFTTPEIDTATAITEILDSDTKMEHVATNEEILKHQAEAFYTGIIAGIDPEIEVEFEFEPTFDVAP